jgi:DNA invertase Pin-like site-specific DNA recombinase
MAANTGESNSDYMRAAIYARVSTRDHGQDTENQLAQLRRYAKTQQWETVE